MNTLKVAVVGLGAIGREHCDIYAALDETDLTAVVDPALTPEEVTDRWAGVRLFSSLDEMLADETVEAISLCTPDQMHFADAKKIMTSGRHLLLEKPIATVPSEAEELADLADGLDVVVMPGHVLRWVPQYHHARQAVAAGAIGEVSHGYVRRNNKGSVAARVDGRVSVAFFLAIHDIDALHWIAGAPVVEVQAQETGIRDASGRQAAAIMATMRLTSGALVQLEAAWDLPEGYPTDLDSRFRLVGTTGELSVDAYGSGISVTADRLTLPSPEDALLYGRAQGALAAEIDSFVRGCLAGDPLPITMREAAQAVMVVDAIEISIRTRQTVEVRQL